MKYFSFTFFFILLTFLQGQNIDPVKRIDEFKIMRGSTKDDTIKCLLVQTYYNVDNEKIGETRYNSPYSIVCNTDSAIYKELIFYKDDSKTIYLNVYNNTSKIDSCVTTLSTIYSDDSKKFIDVLCVCERDTLKYTKKIYFDVIGNKILEKVENTSGNKQDSTIWEYNSKGQLLVYKRYRDWGVYEESKKYDRKGLLRLEKDNGSIFFGPSVKRITYKGGNKKEVKKYSKRGKYKDTRIKDIHVYYEGKLTYDKHIVFKRKENQVIPKSVILTNYFYKKVGDETIIRAEKEVNDNVSITEVYKNSKGEITQIRRDGEVITIYEYIDLLE